MESEVIELEHAVNIDLQKHRHNVYNFSLLEWWLKILVSRVEISGHVSEFSKILTQQVEDVYNKTKEKMIKQSIEKN